MLASSSTTTPGGKGANQAVAAARTGARVAFVGCVGRDEHGDLLRTSLERAGVDVGTLTVVDTVTGYAVIAVTPDGENSIVVAPDANARLEPGAVDASAASWGDRDVVVAQLEISMDTVTPAARSSQRRRARLVLNAAPAAVVAPDVVAVCDPLVVNRQEAATLLRYGGSATGTGLPDGRTTAQALLSLGARSAIVTLVFVVPLPGLADRRHRAARHADASAPVVLDGVADDDRNARDLSNPATAPARDDPSIP